MKSLCSILILMIAVHSLCGAQCLSADLHSAPQQVGSATDQPPCHQHTQHSSSDPIDHGSPQHPHDNNESPCAQVQTFQLKIAPVSKCLPQWIPVEPVSAAMSLQSLAASTSLSRLLDTIPISSASTLPFVLRI
jgi:hypothetical protein